MVGSSLTAHSRKAGPNLGPKLHNLEIDEIGREIDEIANEIGREGIDREKKKEKAKFREKAKLRKLMREKKRGVFSNSQTRKLCRTLKTAKATTTYPPHHHRQPNSAPKKGAPT